MNRAPNFSKNPGCWEQQLIRRYNNPLFPESLSVIIHQQVVEARERDKREQQTFQKRFQDVVEKVSRLPEKAEAEQLLTLMPELSQCYSDCMALCIDLPKEQQALSRLLTLFEETLLKHASDDSAFLQKLEQDRSERKIHHNILNNRLIAAMMRDNSPISIDEMPATLLSSSPTEVELLLKFLDPPQLTALQLQCSELLEGLPSVDDLVTAVYKMINQAANKEVNSPSDGA